MNELKGVWLPIALWETKGLSLLDKHFLAQINYLDNDGGCYASNAYFSGFFDVSKSRCTQVLKKLEQEGFVKIILLRENREVVKRVVNILNKGSELFKQGGKYSKQGGKYIKQGCLEYSDYNNKENKSKEEEREESKAPPLVSDLEEQIFFLKKELEKEKEKSCAKKEKGKHVFPKDSSRAANITVPLHRTDIEQNKLKPYQVFLANYQYKGWSEKLKENFLFFCESKHESSKGRFGATNAKGIISELNAQIVKHPLELIESAILLCATQGWRYDINFEINRRSKQKADEQKRITVDPNISLVERATREAYPNETKDLPSGFFNFMPKDYSGGNG